jgi:hypothetical protein
MEGDQTPFIVEDHCELDYECLDVSLATRRCTAVGKDPPPAAPPAVVGCLDFPLLALNVGKYLIMT